MGFKIRENKLVRLLNYYFFPFSFPLIIFFILCWKWLHESPLWNVKNQKTEAAVKSLVAMRGPVYKVLIHFLTLVLMHFLTLGLIHFLALVLIHFVTSVL